MVVDVVFLAIVVQTRAGLHDDGDDDDDDNHQYEKF